MSTVHDTPAALRELEEILSSAPEGTLPYEVAEEQITRVLRLLAHDEPRWVGVAQATRLLGIEYERTTRWLAERGVLRSRRADCGRLEVRLDDELAHRRMMEGLSAFGGEEPTPEALRIIEESRPGKAPWERTEPAQAS